MDDDDDFAMDAEGDETSAGWCFGVSSMCAVLGSTGSLLLDSGSDEHLCSAKFADLIPTDPDRSLLKLKDVQQNDPTHTGQKTVPLLVGPSGGKQSMEATAKFRVAEVRNNMLSLGKLVRKGFHFILGPCGCSDGTWKRKPKRIVVQTPKSEEELRARYDVLGNAWEFVALRNPARRILRELSFATWERHVQWLLSDKVARHTVSMGAHTSLTPPFDFVIQFEEDVRRRAAKAISEENAT